MPLNWSIEDVTDWQELAEDDEERVVTDSLVFLTMTIGLRSITKANQDEFARRVWVEERVNGRRVKTRDDEDKWVDRPIKARDIARRIGLSTNSSTKTKAEFNKQIMTELSRGE